MGVDTNAVSLLVVVALMLVDVSNRRVFRLGCC